VPAKPLTITEQARRAQLIGVTIDLIARHHYAGTSLARIAEAAGISKAAVLYHFPSKDAVVRAAYDSVLEGLTAYVGAAVAAETGAGIVETYIRSITGYLREHPTHTRMIIEAIGEAPNVDDTPNSPSRQQTMASMVAAARDAGDYRPDIDPFVTAVIVNGALDGIVSESLSNPTFDSAAAAENLIDLLRRSLRLPGPSRT
jgi:AcrR family transcriptional regulator